VCLEVVATASFDVDCPIDFDEFTVRVVKEPEEVKGLLEVGFNYVCQKDNLIFMRKRK